MTEQEQKGPPPLTGSAPEPNNSLLEDASVLLMFHNAAVTNNDPKPTQTSISKQEETPVDQNTVRNPLAIKSEISEVSKQSPPLISPTIAKERDTTYEKSSNPTTRISTPKMSNLASPGPAIAGLVHSTDEDGKDGSKNQKAIVAAAALAAAAVIPLHLVNKNEIQEQEDKQNKASIDEHLRLKADVDDDITDKEEDDTVHTEDEIEPKKEVETDTTSKNSTDDVVMQDLDDDNETAAEDTQEEKPELEEAKQPVKRGRKPKRKASTGKSYTVDPDSGIISCICSFDHDDGFTIQCDVCNRWQHGVCMGISDPDNAPDNYSCSICQPRPVDIKRAQKLQLQVLERIKKTRNNSSSKEKEDRRSKETPTGQNSNSKPKPKPSTPSNPYGKNLEENDIEVPDQKQQHLVQYFQLKVNDYQDQEVYNYVEKLVESNDHVKKFTKSEYAELDFPKLKVKPYSDINSKKFNGISKLGLFTESNIPEEKIITECLGEINFRDRYIKDSRNHYRIWGVEKPYVRFISNSRLVVDSRFSGNSARFIRRSCNPNTDIKIIDVDGTLKFSIVTIKPIKANGELTLGWNWDQYHPINSIIEGSSYDQVSDADKPSLILSIQSILTFVECACSSNSDCCLAKVKRSSSHIYRSSRKNQTTSGLKLFQSKPTHIPIQQRLLDKELSNIRDSSNTKQHVSILSSTQTSQEDVGIRPFIYKYLTLNNNAGSINDNITIITNKRKLEDNESELEYLPIPLPLNTALSSKSDTVSSTGNVTGSVKAPGAVKKLSFADYKKKKKPTV